MIRFDEFFNVEKTSSTKVKFNMNNGNPNQPAWDLLLEDSQVNYYTGYIQSRVDWEYINVYADEGISGTNTKKRVQFNKMIEDAVEGKINLIITKSISRFARNTLVSDMAKNKIFIDTTLSNIADRWREIEIPIFNDEKVFLEVKEKARKAIEDQWNSLKEIDEFRTKYGVYNV